MIARRTQDLALPLGNAAAAFVPFNGAGPFTLTGRLDLPRFLERPVIASSVLGMVTGMRVARQNVIQSNAGFPMSMLFSDQYDDQSGSLSMPLAGALDVEIDCTLDGAGDLSGVVATTPWDQSETDPEVVFGPSAYNFVFGLGTITPGAVVFTLTATATRRVKLGRLCLEAITGPTDVTSIQVAGSEILSGPGAIRIGIGAAANPYHPQASDTDGNYIGKWLNGGESIVIAGLGSAVGVFRGGVFLEA